jgi:hypothetical protein
VKLADVGKKRVPWEVVLHGPGISAEALRRVPLGGLVAEAITSAIEGNRELQDAGAALDARLNRVRRREARRQRGSGFRVEPDLREVADVYLEARRLARPASADIAKAWNVSRPTVTRWLDKARRQGLLPPKED